MYLQKIYTLIYLSTSKLFSWGEVAAENVDMSLLQIQYFMQCILQENENKNQVNSKGSWQYCVLYLGLKRFWMYLSLSSVKRMHRSIISATESAVLQHWTIELLVWWLTVSLSVKPSKVSASSPFYLRMGTNKVSKILSPF
jgi:hypothetical protein